MANIEKLTYKGTAYDISDSKALHQDDIAPWIPDFDSLKVLNTYELDMATTNPIAILQRDNVTDIEDATDILAFRLTITGTNIKQVVDCTMAMIPSAGAVPRIMGFTRTKSTAAATTGTRYIRMIYPKAANTSYKYQVALVAYNATARHVKIEVFRDNSNWTWGSSVTYSYNSTYQSSNDCSVYTYEGLFGNSTQYITANTANSAGYLTSRALFYNSSYSLYTAGAALKANHIAFVSSDDNKVYPITNTTKAVNTDQPLFYISTAVSSGSAISYSYANIWGVVTPDSTISKDTFSAKNNIYCKFTVSNGKVYSANKVTATLAAGNTYYKIGIAYSSSVVVFNVYQSDFFTLNANSRISAINNREIDAVNADTASSATTASSVSVGYLTSSGSYPVLYGGVSASTVPPPTTVVPNINSALSFSPSTGILSATGFSGSGAGLTNIPSSAVADLRPTKSITILDNNGQYQFDTSVLTTSEIYSRLDDAYEGNINLDVVVTDIDTTVTYKYCTPFNYIMMRVLSFGAFIPDSLTNPSGLISSYLVIGFMSSDLSDAQIIKFNPQMPNIPTSISDLTDDIGIQTTGNLVTSVSSSSTDTEYPSAKCVYDAISGISPGSGSGEGYYVGTCSTGASTASKAITVSDSSFSLRNGVRLSVEMTYGNTAAAPKLNINSTGDKPILVAHIATGNVTELNSTAMLQAFSQAGVFDFRYYSAYNSNAGGWILQYTPQVFAVGSRYVGGSRGTTLDLSNIQEGGLRYGLWAATATHAPFSSGVTAAITMFHDSNAAYTRQIAISTGNFPRMAIRTQNNTAWSDWRYVLTAPTELSSANNNLKPACYQYSASLSIDNNVMTIPINGTKYRLTQLQLVNADPDLVFGANELYLFNIAGNTAYKVMDATKLATTTSTSSAITVTFSNSGLNTSTNVQTIAYYAEIE